MKAKYLIIILLSMICVLSACREINVKTTVNPDGSFTRTITITGDSTEVLKSGLPYPVDNTWSHVLKKDSTEEDRFIRIYTKSFKNDEELKEELEKDSSWRKLIARDIGISKRFMFFYSFVTYKEVYEAANPLSLDYREYLSDEDLVWITEEKTPQTWADSNQYLIAEDNATRYWSYALADEIIHALEQGIKIIDNPSLKTIDFQMYRDSIASRALEWASPGKLEQSIDTLIAWTGNHNLTLLKDHEPSIFNELYKKINLADKIFWDETYTVEVEMPGLITGTNSTSLSGNTVSWQIASMTYFFKDYEMLVESRVMNNWAFIISGFLIFLLLLMVIIKIFK